MNFPNNFNPKLSAITPLTNSRVIHLKTESQTLSPFVFRNHNPFRPSENEISFNSPIGEDHKVTSSLINNQRKSRYSTNLSFQTHASILSLYERESKHSLKKDYDYLRTLQKELVSLNNNEDFEVIKEILKKPFKKRSKGELVFLKKAFEPLQYFIDLKENIDENSYEELFTNLKFESAYKNKFVFKVGDIGTKIYLILRGEVSILMPNQNENETGDKTRTNRSLTKPENEFGLEKPPNMKSPKLLPLQKASFSEYSARSTETLLQTLNFVKKHGMGEVFGDGAVNNQGERFIIMLFY